MKATLTTDYFSDPQWVFEPKLDGVRCIAFKNGKNVRLLSRNKLSWTEAYPEIARSIGGQKHDFILDGEIAALSKGRTNFGLLQQARRQTIPAVYFVFDILYLNGRDLRKKPLLERKSALHKALSWKAPLRFVEHVEAEGEAYYEAACKQGLEGVIAKRMDGPYVGRRSRDWLKFKCSNEQEFVIGGFTDPQGSRTGFGALLVGYYDGSDLRYAGKVGTGFNAERLREMRAKLDRLETDKVPFVDIHGVKKKGTHWVKPRLVAQVGFAEWTGDARLRHPRFLGLRSDKNPQEVVREG